MAKNGDVQPENEFVYEAESQMLQSLKIFFFFKSQRQATSLAPSQFKSHMA